MVEVDAEGIGENGSEWFTHKALEVVSAGKAQPPKSKLGRSESNTFEPTQGCGTGRTAKVSSGARARSAAGDVFLNPGKASSRGR